MGKMIELTASDGHKLGAYRAEPAGKDANAGKPRGALVIIQEIFGVNSHMRKVADEYAADGYVAIVPAMFDRVQRNYETGYTPPEIEAGRAIMQKLDWANTLRDVDAAVAEAKKAGKVGIIGYCWGGTVAWRAAANTAGISCSAPFYGGGMPNFINEKPKVPVQAHFGETDQSPTLEQAKAIAKAHPEISANYYPNAGHGFNCDQRPSFNAEASKTSRKRALDFFRQHVG